MIYCNFAATFKKVWDTLGGLDILINNAGLLNDLKWQQTIGVNIVSTTFLRKTISQSIEM